MSEQLRRGDWPADESSDTPSSPRGADIPTQDELDQLRHNCEYHREVACMVSAAHVLWVLDELERLQDAVLAIHARRSGTNDYMAPYTYEYCVEDRQVWPCATVQAIEKNRA